MLSIILDEKVCNNTTNTGGRNHSQEDNKCLQLTGSTTTHFDVIRRELGVLHASTVLAVFSNDVLTSGELRLGLDASFAIYEAMALAYLSFKVLSTHAIDIILFKNNQYFQSVYDLRRKYFGIIASKRKLIEIPINSDLVLFCEPRS